MDLATAGKGGLGTYIGICILSGAFGVADAHVQGGMVGDLSFMLPEFIQVGICYQPKPYTMLFCNICFFFFLNFIFTSSSLFQNLQSFLAGLAASGAITSGLRLITKAAFENSKDGFRKGAGMFKSPYFLNSLLLISTLYLLNVQN